MSKPRPEDTLPPVTIADAEKVLARFGEWPHFHDMEVASLCMDRGGDGGPWVEFVVFAWVYTGAIAPEGHFEQATHSLIRFRCEGVTSSRFDGFNHQNVLDGLGFSPSDEDAECVRVDLPSIFGLGGSLTCRRVRVVEVVPATPDGKAVRAD